MTILKSIGAVLAGFIAVVVLSSGVDWLLELVGIFPPISQPELFVSWMSAVALFYRSIITVIGGYITAWLAPKSPMAHAYALAALGLVGGLAGIYVAVTGNFPDLWYPIALAVTGPLFAILGGWLRDKKA